MTRSRVAALLLLALTGCDTRPLKGPLAAAADSMLHGAPPSRCDTAAAAVAFANARLPLRGCATTLGDTTISLILDDDGKVLIVSRMMPVDTTRQRALHDSIQFAVGESYGAPVICPQSDDRAETEVRLWNTLDRQLVLKNSGRDKVLFELRTDHPQCHRGG